MRVITIFGKLPLIIASAVSAVLVKAFIRNFSVQQVQTASAWVAQEGNQALHPGSV